MDNFIHNVPTRIKGLVTPFSIGTRIRTILFYKENCDDKGKSFVIVILR